MSAQLKNIVTFSNVTAGNSQTLPHGLKDSLGQGLIPDVLSPGIGASVTVTANSTTITVTNNSSTALTISILCESWHSIERDFGSNTIEHLNPQPFAIGQSGGSNFVIHDGSLSGNGTVASPLAAVAGGTAVAHDGTLTGNGLTATPLSVATAPILAVITVRIYDDTAGTIIGGMTKTITAMGTQESIALVTQLNGVADDASTISLQIKTTAGVIRIRPVTFPDSESAGIIINNVDATHFYQSVGNNLAVNFTTSSTSFVDIIAVSIDPVAGSNAQFSAAVNFNWSPT